MAIVLNDITSGYNLPKINANFQKIEDYINDKLMARAATGVAGEAMMERDLDMNGNEILNYPINVTNPNSLVTKAYVDAGDAALQLQINNTLRFPSSVPPSQLPIGAYYNSLQGYNNIGVPVPVFSYTDTADLALKLASTTGTSYVKQNEAPLNLLITDTIFKYMTAADISTITSTLGAEVDVDYALQAAITAGATHVYYPPVLGVYVHGSSVTLPSGFNISGFSRRPYTVSSDSSFNNCGTVIRMKSGASGIFVLSGRNTFRDIIFDGRDKSSAMMNATSQVSGCRYERCGMYRWLRGVGRSSSYVATVYVRGCNISGNFTGVYNLIDSSVLDSVINANDERGVSLTTGANNNSFVRVRVEWNGQEGLYGFSCTGNIYTGEMIDRNGLAGVVSLSGANWIVTSSVVRRNGKLAAAGSSDNCHFRVEGDGSTVIIGSIRTGAGRDDDGGGNLSPEYSIITTGGNTNMNVIVGTSLMNGYSVGSINSVTSAANRNFRNNIGLEDTVLTGISQHANGSSYIGTNPGSLTLATSGTLTYSHNQVPLTTFSRPVRRVLSIMARNTTLATSEYFRVPVLIGRPGSGNATISTIGASIEGTSTWGLSSGSPTGVSVAVSISSDGSTITVTLVGIDSSARSISSELKEG